MADLVLGRKAAGLIVEVISSAPWSIGLTLKRNGVPIPWPAAPVLSFTGISWTATLTDGGTRAEWTQTADEIDAVLALGSRRRNVRLTVEGAVWWSGKVVSHG